MKLLAKPLFMIAATSLSLGIPALEAEQLGSVSYEETSPAKEMIFDLEALAALPPMDAVAVLPPAAVPADDQAVGAELPGPAVGSTGAIGEGSPPGAPPARLGQMCSRHGSAYPLSGSLALSDEQYERLYSLETAFLDQIGPRMLQLGSLSRQLKDALLASNFDPGKITDLSTRINVVKSDIARTKTERLLASAQVLTAEQRKALHDAMIRRSVDLPGIPGMEHRKCHHHH